ncbi:MAG: polysaccharide biosynthesis C-terminal domain-containing protein, partial [Patescibacteria group bacterium]|nr:polysaccharide biosynthesis C-terminal domain-containing protein [Patescibacteria group bacterium]
AASVFLLGLYNLTNVGLFINKMTKTVARNVLIVGAVNIILNLITVPIFGYIAAAVNTLISYILLWLMSYFQTKNILRWSIDSRSFLRIVLSATVMSVILLIISGFVSSTWILITLIFLSIFIYFGTLLALGEIKKEFEYLLQYFKRKLSNVK